MSKRKSKAVDESSVGFGTLAEGAHFRWAHHPDIFCKRAPGALEGSHNAEVVAGPRKGQAFHFADWERCKPCEAPDEAAGLRGG